MITITIVYDNNAHTVGLTTQWGFACLIEMAARTVLFDTGGDAPTLLANMDALDKTPQAVDTVVLSHHHGDHTGGLPGLLDAGARPTVYAPASFSPSFKREVRARTELVEVTDPQEIAPGVVTTGEVSGPIREQALAVQVREGWVLVTGCAHPGIVTMAQVAQRATDGGDLALVMGGFHLGSASAQEIARIIAQLRDRGVDQVAPTHCTGDRARAMFAEAFGERCHLVGAGSTFTFEGA
jgi:7,8-dihydropterin-6-yl-methyl-4-(beta-D-ribofuranosyl)aminobenzene 5'-phosphate synthase